MRSLFSRTSCPVALWFALSLIVGCGSTAPSVQKNAPTSTLQSERANGGQEKAEVSDADDDEAFLEPPKIWADVAVRYEFKCPSPLFTLETPKRWEAAGHVFEIEGSTMRLTSKPFTRRLRIGVVGAPKDASSGTVKNLQKAQRAFKKSKVDIVVVNGDLAEDDDLEDVFMLLGKTFPQPVFLHSGNIEWSASFSAAWSAASQIYPQLFNMNWIRHVDLGLFHLLSQPGYYNSHFLRSGACRYTTEDVQALMPLAKKIRDDGEITILTSHGPPLSKGKKAIDVAFDAGNVGDPALTTLIEESGIPFGLFGHILEAGGRATDNLKTGHVVRSPQKKRTSKLYINAGSASGYGWTLLNGKNSKGMAAIVTISAKGGKVRFLKF